MYKDIKGFCYSMSGSFRKKTRVLDILDLLKDCTRQTCKCPKHKKENKDNVSIEPRSMELALREADTADGQNVFKECFLVDYEFFKKLVFENKLVIYVELLKRDHFFPSKQSTALKMVANNLMSFKSYFSFLKLLNQCVVNSYPIGCISLHRLPIRGKGTRSTGRIILESVHINFANLFQSENYK
jgi:hypothetical protein